MQVRLADNGFMTVLDNVSVPVLSTPARPYRNCDGPRDASVAADVSASDSSVNVYREEVVGPYQVAIIGGEDPMAIRDWLSARGFSVPQSVESIIDHYTSQHSDYVALRLRSGEGIDRIAPVRVTMPGAAPMLPLRMIAAGVGDKVALQLFVIAGTRMEAGNFPNGEIADGDLTYDFNAPTLPSTDFENAFDRLNLAAGGQLWLAESSMTQDRGTLINLAQRTRAPTFGRDAGPCIGQDAGALDADSDGSVDSGLPTCPIPTDPTEDMAVAFEGLGTQAVVTRLRADFLGTALDRDLSLAASTLPPRNRVYQYGRVLNTPPAPPPCPGQGTDAGNATDATADARDGGRAPVDTTGGGCAARCTVTRTPTRGLAFGGIVSVLALALVSRRRRA